MRQLKVPFVKFYLLSFFFRSTIGSLIYFLHLATLVVSDVVDRLTLWCFNTILSYIYPSVSSGSVDAVNISSSAAELDYSTFLRLPLIFTMYHISLPHFKEYILR